VTARRLAQVGPIVAAAAALAGCTGDVGTFGVTLITAPGSTVMDDVTRLRVSLTDPPTVVEAERQDGGFVVELDVSAGGGTGYVLVEGFSADDQRLAFGRSGPLPIAAYDADLAIYMAAPMSIAEAPVSLQPPRSQMGVSSLAYGTVLIGGRDGDGAPVADVAIYNVYDHDLQVGLDMPEALAAPAVMSGSLGRVFVFGGEDGSGDPSSHLRIFDTNAVPAGAWGSGTSDAALARVGATAAPLGSDAFLVTGDPLVRIDGLVNRAVAFPAAPPLVGTATTVLLDDIPNTLVAGDGAGVTGATVFAINAFTGLETAPAEISRTGHGAAALPDGDIVIVGGATPSGPQAAAVRYLSRQRDFTVVDGVLVTPRVDAGVAATASYLVVAGGRDASDQVLGDAEIIDADTLAPVTTLPLLVPRTGATATALPDGQVLIAGGTDADGNPIATLELFTPDR